jgi:SAM-dependent methyltransferase
MKCPICQTENDQKYFLNFKYAEKMHTLYKCSSCECLFYQEKFFFDFKNNFEHNRSLSTYLEKTSDFEALITILYNFLSALPKNYINGVEIGCGAGILIDFVQLVMQKQMIGFEPSSLYSREGRERLKLNIVEDFFSSGYLEGSKVDFAICCQVIQMNDEPILFLQEMRKVLSPQGILILSTPDADLLSKTSDPFTNLSALSPGVHKTIFSKKGLQEAFIKAGFSHVNFFKKDGDLFALAATSDLPEINLFKPNRSVVLNYYRQKLSVLEKDTAFFKGIWYRYYRNKIDHAEYEEALELLKDAHWFEIWTEDEIEDIGTSDNLFELNSAADAIIYYYTGILFLNHLQSPANAEKFFLLSFLLCKKIIQIQPELGIIEKDIIWLAKLHYVLSKAYQGDAEDARSQLIEIVSKNTVNNNSPVSPPQWIISKAESALKEIS